jgi:opacity protein-like surface antigen
MRTGVTMKSDMSHCHPEQRGQNARNSLLLIAALAAGTVSLSPVAVAADINTQQTRNWGGLWFGFGAGYTESSYGGGLDRDFCITSAGGSGNHSAISNCESSDGSVGVGAGAGTPGAAVASTASVAVNGPNSAVGIGAAAILGDGAQASASSDARIPISASASFNVKRDDPDNVDESRIAEVTGPGEGSQLFTGPGVVGLASVGGDTSGDPVSADVTFKLDNLSAAHLVNVVFSDPSRGIVGAASTASASGMDGSAEALAIGLSGLPTSISGSEGGMATFMSRFDHQTEANWVFGVELDLTAAQNARGELSSEVAVDVIGKENSYTVEVDRGIDVETNLLASARLRLGYAMGDFLIYGTGGAAYTSLDATYTANGAFAGLSASRSQSESVNAFGGVIGGGVSAFVSDNAAISLEGLYYKFDETIDFDSEGEEASVTLDDAFSVMMKFSIRAN